jgi:hypothetical protein
MALAVPIQRHGIRALAPEVVLAGAEAQQYLPFLGTTKGRALIQSQISGLQDHHQGWSLNALMKSLA